MAAQLRTSDPVQTHLFARLSLEPLTKRDLFQQSDNGNKAGRLHTIRAFESLRKQKKIVFRAGKWHINACSHCQGSGLEP